MALERDLAYFMYQVKDFTGLMLTLVKGGLSKAARDEIAAASAHFVTKSAAKLGVKLDPTLDAHASEVIGALHDCGYVPVPDVFSGPQIDEIQEFLADKRVSFDSGDGTRIPPGEGLVENAPEGATIVHYKAADLCRCPLIYNVLHDERLLNLAGAYLGAPPTISTVAAWWSFPDPNRPDRDQQFHHDRDDFNVTKLFVYLTDVTPVTGPHAYVLQTHSINALQRSTAQHVSPEAALRFWAWMEKYFKPDDEVLGTFGAERMKVLTGPRGTSFIEDTRGIHRAVYPRTGFRLAFEITFTVLPKYNEKHAPQPRSGLPFISDPDGVSPLARYATRLLYI